MNDFEKVEKLRERANVTYEEAKAALAEANGDILDAMIILENQGKAVKRENASYSTQNDDSRQLPVYAGEADEEDKKKEATGEFGRKMKALFRKLCVNYVVIEKKEQEIIKMPLWLFALIIILGIEIVPIIIVITLFLGIRYSFHGEDEMKFANDAAKKAEKVAGDIVDVVKDEYEKL